jgi:hypothetical protein
LDGEGEIGVAISEEAVGGLAEYCITSALPQKLHGGLPSTEELEQRLKVNV